METIERLIALGIDPSIANAIDKLSETKRLNIIVGGTDTQFAEKFVNVIAGKAANTETTSGDEHQPADHTNEFTTFNEIKSEEDAKAFVSALNSGARVLAPIRSSSALATVNRLEALGVPKELFCSLPNGLTAIIYNTQLQRMCHRCSMGVNQLRIFLSKSQNDELDTLSDQLSSFIDKDKFEDLAIHNKKPCRHHSKHHVFTSILLLNEKVVSVIACKDEVCPTDLEHDEFELVVDTYSHQALSKLLNENLDEFNRHAHAKRAKMLCEAGEIEVTEVIDKLS